MMIVSDTLRVDSMLPLVQHVTQVDTSIRVVEKAVDNLPVSTEMKRTKSVVPAVEWVAPEEVEPYDTIIIPETLRPVEPDTICFDSLVAGHFIWDKEIPSEDWLEGDSLMVEAWDRVMVPSDGRMAGDPLVFRMATDNYIGSSLLLCFFLIALLAARAQHYLALSIKEFFNDRPRENMFNDSSEARMQGKFFFSLAMCFSLGVLFLNYQQLFLSDVFREVSPYVVLGVNVAGCLLGYGLRTLLFAFVNTVFFDREQNAKWMEAYNLLTIAASILLVPLALLVVFYEMDFAKWQILFSLSVFLIEIFLIFKTYRVFFDGVLGCLYIILYLCTLEFLPLLSMWKGMVWVTQELTKLV